MNCEQARSRWHECRDHGAADAALEQHLAGCAECRDYAAEQACLMELLGELRADTQGLTCSGTTAPPRDRRGWLAYPYRLRRVSGIAAAILLLVSAGYLVSQMSDQPVQDHRTTVTNTSTDDVAEALPESTAPLGITLRNESAATMLAVARPTSQAKVKVYWLYTSLNSDRPTQDAANDLEQPM